MRKRESSNDPDTAHLVTVDSVSFRETLQQQLYGGLREDEASYYWVDRVQLLPQNSFFLSRVRETRSVLGLPENGISDVILSPSAQRQRRLVGIDRISKESLGLYFMEVHSAKALGAPVPKQYLPPGFPRWFRKLLNSQELLYVDTHSQSSWMHRSPEFVPGFPDTDLGKYDDRVPLDRFAALLVEAFRLPLGMFRDVRAYVVIGDERVLRWEGPLDVRITGLVGGSRRILQVSVSGIDAWTTKSQWSEVFDKHIRLVQEEQWNALGWKPANRRRQPPDAAELRFYDLVRVRGLKLDAALDEMSDNPSWHDVGRNKAYAAIRKLDKLMNPEF